MKKRITYVIVIYGFSLFNFSGRRKSFSSSRIRESEHAFLISYHMLGCPAPLAAEMK